MEKNKTTTNRSSHCNHYLSSGDYLSRYFFPYCLITALKLLKLFNVGNSLVVQWLGFFTSTARDSGLIPGLGTKIQPAAWCSQKKKKEKRKKVLFGTIIKKNLNIEFTSPCQ